MALDFQNVPISFDKGVDTKTDPKQVIPGKMLSLQNASFKNPKEIQKRDGIQALTQNILGGGTISSGVGIATFKNELDILDGQNLYKYSPGTASNVKAGPLVTSSLSVQSITRDTYVQSQPDSAYHAGTGLQIFVYRDSVTASTINYTIIDSANGSQIVSNQTVTSNAANLHVAKVLCTGVYFVILYVDSGTGFLVCRIINTATPTSIGLQTTIANDAYNGGGYFLFDATIINGSIYLVYWQAGGGGESLAFYSISPTLVLSSQYLVANATSMNCLNIKGDASNNVWAFFGTSANGVYGLVVNSALNSTILGNTQITASLDILNVTGIISGTTASVYYEIGGSYNSRIGQNTLTIGGTAGTASTAIRQMGLASKVFSYNSMTFGLLVYAGNYASGSIEQTYFLFDYTSGIVVGKIAPGNGGGLLTQAILPEVNQIGNVFQVPYLFKDDLSSAGGNVFYNTGVNSANFTLSVSAAPPKLQNGNNLHIGGSELWMYDGQTVAEHGFAVYPENISPAQTLSGGAIGNGTLTSTTNQIQYCAVYEWQDNQGQIHRSAPSIPVTVILPANSFLSAHTFTGTTNALSNVIIAVSSLSGLFAGQVITDSTNATNFPAGTYITKIGPSNTITVSNPAAGSHSGDTLSTLDVVSIAVTIPTLTATSKPNVSIALYRTQLNQDIFYRVSSLTSLTYNDKTVDTVTITDTVGDLVLSGNEQLYTTGGELENIAAPAVSALASFKTRAVYLSPENPFQFGYSKPIIDGSPVEFNSQEFVQNVDQRLGPLNACAQLDDKLILFGDSVKSYVVGDGPTPAGTQNDFTDATKIAGVSGTSNPNSVLEIPDGLIYQDTEKGIWLLDRSLAEHYIGADVEQYNSQTVTSARLIPNSTKAELTLSGGTNLVYDYFVGQWEFDPYASAAVDSTIYQSNFTFIQANGVVQEQTPGVFNDNGALIPLGFKTGPFSFAGVEGFQRVTELQILGTYKSPHTLTVNIYADYASSPVETIVIPVLSQPKNYSFRIKLKTQKCEALQVELSESQSGSIGEGFSLSSLAFRVGVKKGLNKLPASQSY